MAHDPSFRYSPDLFWDSEATDSKAVIPPGPNNPVGVVWSLEGKGLGGPLYAELVRRTFAR